jgi:hypothetical protein
MPRTVLPIVVMLVLSCLPVSSQTDIVDLRRPEKRCQWH